MGSGRRGSQEEQLATERSFLDYFEQLPVGAYRTTRDGTILEANPAAARLFGYDSVEELLRSNVRERYVRPADRAKLIEAVEADSRFEGFEFPLRRRDGDVVWVRMSGRGVANEAGSIEWIEGVLEDVSDARRLQDDLRRNEEKFRLLFDSNPLPTWVYDRETLGFLAVNQAAVANYGYTEDEFKEMSLVDIRPAEDVADLMADVAQRDSASQSGAAWRHVTKAGSVLDVEISSHTVDFGGRAAVLVVALDVTERTRLEREREGLEANLRQAQKMDAMGRLAGGIAHDFNNLLSIIGNYSLFVREALPVGSPIVDDVDEIRKATDRAGALVRQLLAFSHKGAVVTEPVAVNDVISDMEKMLARTIGEDIVLDVRRDPSVESVLMDRSQLEQILVNLAVNARDAMPRGGSLTIATETDVIIAPSGGIDLEPGHYVRITFADSGEGISPDVRDNIFDPFFTTKAPGSGTGLGLSTVYGIVAQVGGHVGVHSEPGRGTRFDILLPITDELSVAPATEPPSQRAGGEATILVVEDEAGVRQICERILETAGYEVNAVEGTSEAIRLYEEDPDRFDLVLSDIVMPGMSGPEMIQHLRSKHPGIRTVYMSGYNEDFDGFDLPPATMLVNKPFDRDALLDAIVSSLAADHERA